MLQQLMEAHRVRMCQHSRALLSERVLDAREDKNCDASRAGELYVYSWRNHLKRIEQLVHNSIRTGDVQVQIQVIASGGVDESNNVSTSPGDAENDAFAGPSSE